MIADDSRLFHGLEDAVAAAPCEREIDWGDDSRPFPVPDSAMFYGLSGEIVAAVEPQTEANKVALLATLITGFGNAAGPGPHFVYHADLHPGRIFTVLVGKTGSGKGSTDAVIRPILQRADPHWADKCKKTGFSSGESIISEVGTFDDGTSSAAVEHEPTEKRLLITETELGRLLAVNSREGSTLRPILCIAYDSGDLEQRLTKKKRYVAKGAHISFIAHVTPTELRGGLDNVSIAGGFGNRLTFVMTRPSRMLPSGGHVDPEIIERYGERLRSALMSARSVGNMERSSAAAILWHEFYERDWELAKTKSELIGALTNRWRAQKLRASVIYALLDKSPIIDAQHILAAEAYWRYAADSVEYIWGDAAGGKLEEKLLIAIRKVYPSGLSQTDQWKAIGRNGPLSNLETVRASLLQRNLIRISPGPLSGGRTATVAYAIEPDNRPATSNLNPLAERLLGYVPKSRRIEV